MKILLPVILVLSMIGNADAGKADRYIAYFGAEWCEPCQKMKESWNDERVRKLVKKYRTGQAYYIDIDKSPNEAVKYFVTSVPTVLILDKQGRVLKRAVGYMNSEQLLVFLDGEPKNNITRLVGDEEVFVFPLASIARYIIILIAKFALGLLT